MARDAASHRRTRLHIAFAVTTCVGVIGGCGEAQLWAPINEETAGPDRWTDHSVWIDGDSENSPGEMAMMSLPTPKHVTIFMNRKGGTYYSSKSDDSSAHKSSVLRYLGYGSLALTPWDGSDANWSMVMDCYKKQFSAYDITVTDQRPTSGEYIEAVISADGPDVMGFESGVGGVSPVSCAVIPRSVVFVFGHYLNLEQVCEVTAHEVGHSLSLDHEYLCEDNMTYLWGCDSKRFVDVDADCGELDPRGCSCGRATQNSHKIILGLVGPASGTPPVTPPISDSIAPTVKIDSPADGASLTATFPVSVKATVTDNQGLSKVELIWNFTNSALACPGSGAGWSCTVSGSSYSWKVDGGSGDRAFSVKATDTAGNVTQSPDRTIHLQQSSSGTGVPPTITVLSPADGSTLSLGGALAAAVEVNGNGTSILNVRLISSGSNGSFTYSLMKDYKRTNTWVLNSIVPKSTPIGDRTFTFTATSAKGAKATSTPIIVHIAK